MNTDKIEKTPQIVERLKELKRIHKQSSQEIATLLGIRIDIYKNIIRNKGGVKYIPSKLIRKIADIYECTPDYILCKSNDPTLNRMGIEEIRPISFSEKDTMLTELVNYLQKDTKTLQNLYFFFTQLPLTYRLDIISAINTFTEILRSNSIWGRSDNLNPKKIDFLINCLNLNDIEYSSAAVQLSEADKYFDIPCYEDALPKYIGIIYDTITKSLKIAPIADYASDKILSLLNNWSDFPQELRFFEEALPKMKKSRYTSTPNETKEKIADYLSKKDYL